MVRRITIAIVVFILISAAGFWVLTTEACNIKAHFREIGAFYTFLVEFEQM